MSEFEGYKGPVEGESNEESFLRALENYKIFFEKEGREPSKNSKNEQEKILYATLKSWRRKARYRIRQDNGEKVPPSVHPLSHEKIGLLEEAGVILNPVERQKNKLKEEIKGDALQIVEFLHRMSGREPSHHSRDPVEKRLGNRLKNLRWAYRNEIALKKGEKPKGKERLPDDVVDYLLSIGIILDRNNDTHKYNNLLSQADYHFLNKEYELAKVKYQEALSLKKNERYPINRIADIEDILFSKVREKKYKDIVEAADTFFEAENYYEARKLYQEAFNIKKNDSYSKEQIDKINKILNEESKDK